MKVFWEEIESGDRASLTENGGEPLLGSDHTGQGFQADGWSSVREWGA
jgi:hypothetical protein